MDRRGNPRAEGYLLYISSNDTLCLSSAVSQALLRGIAGFQYPRLNSDVYARLLFCAANSATLAWPNAERAIMMVNPSTPFSVGSVLDYRFPHLYVLYSREREVSCVRSVSAYNAILYPGLNRFAFHRNAPCVHAGPCTLDIQCACGINSAHCTGSCRCATTCAACCRILDDPFNDSDSLLQASDGGKAATAPT